MGLSINSLLHIINKIVRVCNDSDAYIKVNHHHIKKTITNTKSDKKMMTENTVQVNQVGTPILERQQV